MTKIDLKKLVDFHLSKKKVQFIEMFRLLLVLSILNFAHTNSNFDENFFNWNFKNAEQKSSFSSRHDQCEVQLNFFDRELSERKEWAVKCNTSRDN